jgi:hypothetical protein
MQNIRRYLLTAVVLLGTASVFGEGLTVHSVVDTRFEGALGSIMGLASRMSGTNLRNVDTTTYLQGHRMRTDSALSGMILDLDGERVITIDHKQKTYTSMTFAEMRDSMERARASAERERAKEQTKTTPATGEKKDELNVKYQVAVDRTGQREKVSGYEAERVFITITLEAEAASEGKKTEQVGSMVFLLDQWVSKNAPQGPAFTEFNKLYAQKLGKEFRAQAQGLQAAFASDPRLKDGFEAAGKEMQKIQGVPLRSTTHVVLVPANMALDRQLAVDGAASSAAAVAKTAEAEKTEKPKSGFGGFMKAIKTVAEDAGRQMEKGNQSKNAPPQQSTLLVMTDEVKSISTGDVAAAMFTPPADYRELKSNSR